MFISPQGPFVTTLFAFCDGDVDIQFTMLKHCVFRSDVKGSVGEEGDWWAEICIFFDHCDGV